MSKTKPVILLAFSDPRNEKALRVREEYQRIRDVFELLSDKLEIVYFDAATAEGPTSSVSKPMANA